ncbi:MAG: hypothetical protein ACOZIN_08590 [Myxococcota bacterium]
MSRRRKKSSPPGEGIRKTRTRKTLRQVGSRKVETTTKTSEVICTGEGEFCRKLRRILGRGAKVLLEPV